jgi:2-polyprenyl-6-methoxyphenol hydroxylase-like FAD-dependent oxidoreductase
MHDVVIVGARAAGAATALLLARLGHDVVLLDRADFPSDTLSTHQLARPGVVQLARWGLLDDVLASGAPALREAHISAFGETFSRTIKDYAGVDLLVAPRRYVLDSLVVEAAARAGADVRTGVTVTGVCHSPDGRVVGVTGHSRSGAPLRIDARYVVGADGLTSRVARSVGARFTDRRPDGSASEYAYYDGVAWHGIELHIEERAFAGVFPTHDGAACVWMSSPSAQARAARRTTAGRAQGFAHRLEQAVPALAARVRTGRQLTPPTGMLKMPNHVRQAYGPGWTLVGDAGYHRDAITGHGLSDAYRDAELLASALSDVLAGRNDEHTALRGYERQRDLSLREVFDLTCEIATFPGVPRFVELQKQFSLALDREALELAARPNLGRPQLVGN